VKKTDLASQLGISKQAVYKWYRADRIPAERIAEIKTAFPHLKLADIRPDVADV